MYTPTTRLDRLKLALNSINVHLIQHKVYDSEELELWAEIGKRLRHKIALETAREFEQPIMEVLA